MLDKLEQEGVAIVMVSHDIEFCARYADAVAMMFDGEIACTEPSGEFFGYIVEAVEGKTYDQAAEAWIAKPQAKVDAWLQS